MKKKLLALYCRPPLLGLPQNSYGQYHILNAANQFVETQILSFKSSANNSQENLYFDPNDSKIIKIINLILRGRSTRLTHYWSNDFFNAYKVLINDFKPDILYVDNLLMMQYPIAYTPKANIWFYDDESPLFVKEYSLRENIFEKIRNIGLSKFEKKAISFSDRTFCITDEESMHLNSLGFKSIQTLPYPIDDEYFFYGWKPPRSEFSVLFVGDFAHYPNKEAAKIICTKIYPALKDNKIKFILVGRNFKRIKSYLNDEISTFENVEDVRPYYWSSSLFIAPIFSGAGMRIKILEAASCGTPIVMSQLANSGINMVKSTEAFLVNNVDEMIETILTIYNSGSQNLIQISEHANHKIRSLYSLKKMIDFYKKIFSNYV
jgi:glycosyltransferase involved in cell wall biosynthesis